MTRATSTNLRPVHPFPARMAPSIALRELPTGKKLRVLDCMAGSGTTLVAARSLGHTAIGFDTDPLAVLIARAWCTNFRKDVAETKAAEVLRRARAAYSRFSKRTAYPIGADEETRDFVRFWFDDTNRRQLASLSRAIARVKDHNLRSLFWCALSKMIITKRAGVSLAMDVSHSRPHKVYSVAPVKVFSRFLKSVKSILSASPFVDTNRQIPRARINQADARQLPLEAGSIDLVITSPPYLNAINYLRGHKLALVWMGHRVKGLRTIRTNNVGTEVSSGLRRREAFIDRTLERMGAVNRLPDRYRGMIARYVLDMDQVIGEIKRVLTRKGRAVFVVGDSTIQGTFVKNSKAVQCLGVRHGLRLVSVRRRKLPAIRRYLPPPNSVEAGTQLRKRMIEEVIIAFQKTEHTN
jgi:tRNA G10  N-methylase Trm11